MTPVQRRDPGLTAECGFRSGDHAPQPVTHVWAVFAGKAETARYPRMQQGQAGDGSMIDLRRDTVSRPTEAMRQAVG